MIQGWRMYVTHVTPPSCWIVCWIGCWIVTLPINWRSTCPLCVCSPRLSSGQDPNVLVIVRSPKPSRVPPDHVLVRVDKFGFSANNITYQALGEHPRFRYFDFHPAPESTSSGCSSRTHGLIPVWGFGTVVTSTHPRIKEGERIYGYFAPTRYLLLPVASDVNKFSFYVPRPHLPADRRPYNQILRCETDPQYMPMPMAEDLAMLYRPLFWTSYWFEDWLQSSGYRGGVDGIVISSASAKTAFCLAYLLGKRLRRGEISQKTKIIGLTSRRNSLFTKGLGLYHEVIEYDSVTSLQAGADQKWLYIDVADNENLNKEIRAHFSLLQTPRLVAWIVLGGTNLSPSSTNSTFFMDTREAEDDVLPRVETFFMPEWLEIRRIQIPHREIFQRQNEAWKELMNDCTRWVELERVYGPVSVQQAYRKLAKEGLGAEKGYIWSLWDSTNSTNTNNRSRL